MLEQVLLENKYLNIDEWVKNRIDGYGIVVWNTEGGGSHGETVSRRVKDSAPNCTLFEASLEMSYDSNEIKYANAYHNGVRYSIDDFIAENKINIITRSVAGKKSPAHVVEFWQQLKDKYGLILLNSSGNDGVNGIVASLPHEIAWYIGACRISSGSVKIEPYSSVGEEVDFATFVGVWSGTSFACPYLAGQVALLKQRYGVTEKEAFKYMVMIANDVGENGKDNKSGYGLPVLPPFAKRYIAMTTTSNKYKVDGKEFEMDTRPVNNNGCVFVPIRVISESLGGNVEWSFNADKTVKVEINNRIILNTGSDVAFVDGKKIYLNFPPYIDSNNRTMVPIRLIAEQLNCKVDWIQSESKVMILEV